MTCDLSIIIVSWNVWDLLRANLAAIEEASRAGDAPRLRLFGPADQPRTLEVIVVDNASEDATTSVLPGRFPWVRLVESERNLGFTGGNNLGYGASSGRFVYFLNPDTELVDDSLWTLFSTIEREPTVGMVGPQLRYPDGFLQNNRRRFPRRLTGFFESTWLGQAWPANPWTVHMHMLDWPDDVRHDVDWLVGAAMLARRDALDAACAQDEAGPFDDTFFMYSEELDLCKRIKNAGWRIVYEPAATVIHYEGRSSEQVPAFRHIRFNASKVAYYLKYFGPRWAELLRRYLLLEFRWQLLLERGKHALGHKRGVRAARMAAYREVLASRLRTEKPPDA